jgi:zeta-carotene desaturase
MTSPRTVAIAGGGLAGLSAACALAEAGFRVTLFERRPYLGGRASSYELPATGEVVDNCQHVLLGCCTNLVEFYRRIGVSEKIRWYDRLTFIEPGGRRSTLAPSWLPAPLHNSPAFLRAPMLSLRDKAAIARALLALARGTPKKRGNQTDGAPHLPAFGKCGTESFLDWLRSHHQTDRAIEHLWKPVLVSALNEDLDRISVPYGALVFRESFLKSRAGGLMGVPAVPLGDLYSAAGDFIRARGGAVHLRATVDFFAPLTDGVKLCAGGSEFRADFAILAAPFDALLRLLPAEPVAEPLRKLLTQFETSPITGIHLWFDREITELDHAVLLDRTIQWLFHKSKLLADSRNAQRETRNEASYIELVVSSSKSLVDKPRQEIIDLALKELKEFFPRAAEAKLIQATVVKEVHATFSPLPGSDAYRPGAGTPWPRVFLAGDWTATGWPATMESAVRSGHLSAEALAQASGAKVRFLVPDLPAAGLMRLLR